MYVAPSAPKQQQISPVPPELLRRFHFATPQTRREAPRFDAAHLEAQLPSSLGQQFKFLAPDDLVNLARTSKYLNRAINNSPQFQSKEAEALKDATWKLERAQHKASVILRPLRERLSRLSQALKDVKAAGDAFTTTPLPWYKIVTDSKLTALRVYGDNLRDALRNVESAAEELSDMKAGIDKGLDLLLSNLAECRATFKASIHAGGSTSAPPANDSSIDMEQPD